MENTTTQQKNQEMKTANVVGCLTILYELKMKIINKKISEIINCTENNKLNLLKELYKRLLVPLYIPVLMLIPYFLILSSKEKKNYSKLKVSTFLIGVITIIFSEGIIKFLSLDFFNNILIFFTPIMLFLFLYLMFLLKLKFKN